MVHGRDHRCRDGLERLLCTLGLVATSEAFSWRRPRSVVEATGWYHKTTQCGGHGMVYLRLPLADPCREHVHVGGNSQRGLRHGHASVDLPQP